MKLLRGLSPRLFINFKLMLFILSICILLRLGFIITFAQSSGEYSTSDFIKAFYLGLKFDVRISILLCLPFLFFSVLPILNPIKNKSILKLWLLLYTFIASLLVAVYFFDFAYYAYLQDRLNASILQFLENLSISLKMVWQTYPVIAIIFGYLFCTWATSKLLDKLVFNTKEWSTPHRTWKEFWLQFIAVSLIIIGGLYGKLSHYPLRWSEAFFSGNRFISAIAINPLHYFFDTLVNFEKNYDIEKVKKYYPLISEYLGVDKPDLDSLNFTRIQKPQANPIFTSPPNIVVIVMESLSAHRMGIFGNQLSATPHLDKISKSAWSFSNFYTPSEGTARGIFALITSLADINKGRTSSRNPLIVDQNSAANYFTNYQKFYFIGGSANWGNIRGVLTNNITDLELYDEDRLNSERTDVWGVSDYHLFKEAHQVLDNSKKPFLAFIQTAGFHRPYTIPEDKGDFELQNPKLDELKKWGYESVEEYNSLLFSDFSLNNYLNLARQSNYFENTLFIVLGDHGLPDNEAANLTPTMQKFSIERFHTPLIFYSPKHLQAKTIENTVNQQDILPTVAALTGHSFINKSLGRNILDERFSQYHYTFSYVYYRNPHSIFLFDKDYFVTGTPSHVNQLYNFREYGTPNDIKVELPEKFNQMKDLLLGLYETSKYMLYNNKKPLNEAGLNKESGGSHNQPE